VNYLSPPDVPLLHPPALFQSGIQRPVSTREDGPFLSPLRGCLFFFVTGPLTRSFLVCRTVIRTLGNPEKRCPLFTPHPEDFRPNFFCSFFFAASFLSVLTFSVTSLFMIARVSADGVLCLLDFLSNLSSLPSVASKPVALPATLPDAPRYRAEELPLSTSAFFSVHHQLSSGQSHS